ncbi:hypothetical protein MMC17_001101 [Xylographa soralifera]|nr:hypothetical protein [Xylographa soralifera]
MSQEQQGFQPSPFSAWPKRPSKKRIIICCDGTWQSSAHGTQNIPSNAAKMSHCLSNYFTDKNGELCPQIIYYDSGIGTGMSVVQSKWYGLTGEGLDENVCEAYNFLVGNYNPGDEIFFFGFSRGAYTVRAAAGLVCNVGICKPVGMSQFWEMYAMYKAYPGQDLQRTPWAKRLPEGAKPSKFMIKVKGKDMDFMTESGWSWMANTQRDVDVKVVGVWDTVGSLGIPEIQYIPYTADSSAYAFHDTSLHKEIKNAFHALALDECRKPFSPTIWSLPEGSTTNLIQCWFPGSHVNIGGGSDDGLRNKRGDLECMANTTFAWMVDRCQPFLAFDFEPLGEIMTDYISSLNQIIEISQKSASETQYGGWGTSGPLHDSYRGILNTMWGYKLRHPGEYFNSPITGECIHPVVYHAREKGKYDEPSLRGFERVPAKDEQPPYWTKTYEVVDQPHGLAERLWSYVPGLAAKPGRKTKTVKIPEFVIPTKIADPQDRLGFPVERALVMNVSNRAGFGMSEDERRKVARARDREGLEFLQRLDRENAGLLG